METSTSKNNGSLVVVDRSTHIQAQQPAKIPLLPNSGMKYISISEASESELLGKSVKTADEAYDLYNRYAFKIGFGIRKNRTRRKLNEVVGKDFVCCKEGFKQEKGKYGKTYTKIDCRTGCEAMVYFEHNKESGLWTVTEHKMVHNHEFCNAQQRHKLRSHKNVIEEDLAFISQLKERGIKLEEAMRILKGIYGGSANVDSVDKDVNNSIGESTGTLIQGTDAHWIIRMFQQRQLSEKDFFYDFEVDESCRLVSFFWRDGRMKADYNLFHDVLIFDTCRIKKYNMICVPFVGMDNHGHNVMFGCGFLMNERIESFVWLFEVFKRSMNEIQPATVMTDQSFSMASAMDKVFPLSVHRLCTWHIEENSRRHIKALRKKQDFVKNFDHCLLQCESEAEFEYYWRRLLDDYSCHDNHWLKTLYSTREKWCPAFFKDYFSGGILATQVSKTTNHIIRRRLHDLISLLDFYNHVTLITSEWRSKERGIDFRCRQGKVETLLQDVSILNYALDVYTIEAFDVFEKHFNRGASLFQKVVGVNEQKVTYQLWVPNQDNFSHVVIFDMQDHSISCTCKKFEQVGILCCHCLRIYHINCVMKIPERYISKRWTIDFTNVYYDDWQCDLNDSSEVNHSLWRKEMTRKFKTLVSSSEWNSKARSLCENLFEKAKEEIMKEVGPIFFENNDTIAKSMENAVRYPASNSEKSQSNKQRLSINQRLANITRAKYKKMKKPNKGAAGQRFRLALASSV